MALFKNWSNYSECLAWQGSKGYSSFSITCNWVSYFPQTHYTVPVKNDFAVDNIRPLHAESMHNTVTLVTAEGAAINWICCWQSVASWVQICCAMQRIDKKWSLDRCALKLSLLMFTFEKFFFFLMSTCNSMEKKKKEECNLWSATKLPRTLLVIEWHF